MKKEAFKSMLVHNQTITQDFWDYLSEKQKANIQKGLADVDAGRFSDSKSFLKRLMSK